MLKIESRKRWSWRNVGIAAAVGIGLTCCVCFPFAVFILGRVTPTPGPSLAQTAMPTWTLPFVSPTIVERVITLTPKPMATQTRPPALGAPTQTPALAVLSTETPTPVIIPMDTPPPAATNYDRNGDGKVTCADFSTQAEAQAAYNAGYTNLDGNDNDGLACESLP